MPDGKGECHHHGYGPHQEMDAMSKAEVRALCIIADRLENGESKPVSIKFSVQLAA
jgi:hypothetical protein